MEKIVGHYDHLDGKKVIQHIEFTEDGKVFQNGTSVSGHLGNWKIVEENMIVITYINKEYGHTVLSFDDDNTVFGSNRYNNGNTIDWILVRVEGISGAAKKVSTIT